MTRPRGCRPVRQVIVDTGRTRVEVHPDHGVIIAGVLIVEVVNGEPVFVPAR